MYSAQTVGKWNNTLHGQRKAKLEAKKNREEKEAEGRRNDDIAEAIYQSEQRRTAIEHAKTLTFARTDRVKEFHGALILTEVLKVTHILQIALKLVTFLQKLYFRNEKLKSTLTRVDNN